MADNTTRLELALFVADADLDEAWRTGVGLEAALQVARRKSREIGRDPIIQDAKLAVARLNDFSPSVAFAALMEVSQQTNRKVCDIACEIVEVIGHHERLDDPGGHSN
jgi:hypothetical protein